MIKGQRRACEKRNLKVAKKHQNKLTSMLKVFFSLLDEQPKPAAETIRSKFLELHTEWLAYCTDNKLDGRASLLFNARVAYEWENKYAQPKKA